MIPTHTSVTDATREWLEKAVIGLNLCPFAKAVHVKGQVRYVVSDASDAEALLGDLVRELEFLHQAEPEEVETTLLVHPLVLTDFMDYNSFLDLADAAVLEMGLEGELQVASFHPDYQFAGTDRDHAENLSNRSPFPTLHLLREASIEAALETFPDADSIYERNIETLQMLGPEGWKKLWA